MQAELAISLVRAAAAAAGSYTTKPPLSSLYKVVIDPRLRSTVGVCDSRSAGATIKLARSHVRDSRDCDVLETIAHEVAHLYVWGHPKAFHEVHVEMRRCVADMWRRTGGDEATAQALLSMREYTGHLRLYKSPFTQRTCYGYAHHANGTKRTVLILTEVRPQRYDGAVAREVLVDGMWNGKREHVCHELSLRDAVSQMVLHFTDGQYDFIAPRRATNRIRRGYAALIQKKSRAGQGSWWAPDEVAGHTPEGWYVVEWQRANILKVADALDMAATACGWWTNEKARAAVAV